MAETTPIGELEQLILLAILRLGPDAYGLCIARELEAQAGRRLSRGALYTIARSPGGEGTAALAAGGRRARAPGAAEAGLRGAAAWRHALRTSQRVLRRMWRGLDRILKDPS